MSDIKKLAQKYKQMLPEYEKALPKICFAEDNLKNSLRYSQRLYEMVSQGSLPDWCDEKVAIAKYLLEDVYNYVANEKGILSSQAQGLFDGDPFGKGMADLSKGREEAEEKRKAEDREENQKILDQVLAWYQQFGVMPDSDTQKDILEHNRKSSLTLKDITSFGELGEGWYDLDAKVDMSTGEIIVNNFRAGFSGPNIPETLKARIEQASGKRLSYHKPTDAWVYDAELDGGLDPGDSKMLEIARKLLRS